jgi:CSLREA domain-containing protein
MRRAFATAVILTASLMTVFAQPAPAATFAVTSSGDAGDAAPGNATCATAAGQCTFRAGVEEANALSGGDRITVPGLNIALGAQLSITSPLEVIGAGAAATVVDGGSGRVFYVNGGPVTLRAMTVQGGGAAGGVPGGGGLYVDSGSAVNIQDARIADNRAFTGGGGLFVRAGAQMTVLRTAIEDNDAVGAFGGGIWNSGTLFVRESLVAGNDSNRTGGIYNATGSILNLRNTTVSGNTVHSPQAGTGGLVNVGFAFLNNVTITDNTGIGNNIGSFLGGGLASAPGATTVMKNSILAGNNGVGGPPDCAGALTSDSRYNLIGDTSGCQLPLTNTYILNVSAQLGPLALNGGPTRTHLPAATSPAIDAGYPFPPGGPAADSCEAFDQRGIPRILCDLGAVERGVPIPTQLVVTTTADQVDVLPGNGHCATASGVCSLRAAVQEANRLPGRQRIIVPAGLYVLATAPANEGGFDPAAAGDLDLLDAVTVTGKNRLRTIVDGNDLSRIFDVAPGQIATISRMTIRDGNDIGGGGLRVTSASLTLNDAMVLSNVSSFSGGGIEMGGLGARLVVNRSLVRRNRSPFFGGDGGGIAGNGKITISRSSITGNEASGAGGGVRGIGTVTVTQSTIAGNRTMGSVLANGGGISANGLNLVRSTVSGNSADAQGGGVFGSGSIVNSTISGNVSATNGGGLSTSGSLSLLHVTVARNWAAAGGNALHRFGFGSVLALRNTILANAPGSECAALAPTSNGNNIASDSSCALTASGDKQGTNAALGPLAYNGGPTPTHLPGLASPAIGAATNAGVTIDQRGVARPQGAAPDVGSVERN